MKKQKGITIIALIITIILMLILATVSVNVAISGGIFEKARDAVDSTEIANEKDTVVKANILAKSKNKTVTVDDVQKALNSVVDENKATAIDNGDSIIVKFNESDRYYELEPSGKVEGPKELVKDDYAGDITKGGRCDGSTEKPYEIWCIEDLVAFSKLINNDEIKLNCNVILMRTLNFKSIFSYNDYEAKYSYDETTVSYIKDSEAETTIMELCLNDKGFIPIGISKGVSITQCFKGNFEGQGYEIQNLYVNSTINGGLFSAIDKVTIRNLGITGNIISTSSYTGGLAGFNSSGNIYNCYNKARIQGKGTVGGIYGYSTSGSKGYCEDCYNYGEVTSLGQYAGGIAGGSPGTFVNCYNEGNVTSNIEWAVGGIVGFATGNIVMTNCYNTGDITGCDYIRWFAWKKRRKWK